MERQENDKLVKAHQDKDDLIDKLREEIDLLNRVSLTAYSPFLSARLRRCGVSALFPSPPVSLCLKTQTGRRPCLLTCLSHRGRCYSAVADRAGVMLTQRCAPAEHGEAEGPGAASGLAAVCVEPTSPVCSQSA